MCTSLTPWRPAACRWAVFSAELWVGRGRVWAKGAMYVSDAMETGSVQVGGVAGCRWLGGGGREGFVAGEAMYISDSMETSSVQVGSLASGLFAFELS
jgi:hypothetical protein